MKRHPLAVIFALTLALASAGDVSGQPVSQAAQQAASFDIVSIRPSLSEKSEGSFRPHGAAGLDLNGMSVRELLTYAWPLRDYQIIGLPDWARSARWDIKARDSTIAAPSSGTHTQQQRNDILSTNFLKLRQLLAERFGLKHHMEKRQVPARALRVADVSRLQPAPCSNSYWLMHGIAKGSMPVHNLASLVGVELQMPVKDETALSGCYNLDIHFTTDPGNTELPSAETALKDAGFKLIKTTAEVEVLVVDAVTKPELEESSQP